MRYLQDYIKSQLADGNLFFTKKAAISTLRINENQFRCQVYRLSQKRILENLGHALYMIISPQFSHLGSLPPQWIIGPYMGHLRQDYYVGLLTAASLYGATQQQPMRFQVITNKVTRRINLPRGGIDFHVSTNMGKAKTQELNAYTGSFKISTREQTIVDLVRFYKVSGHLSNVASVIKELAKDVSAVELEKVIKQEKNIASLQRLGYILSLLKFPKLAKAVEEELAKRKTQYICLYPNLKSKAGKKINRWKLIINDSLEIE